MGRLAPQRHDFARATPLTHAERHGFVLLSDIKGLCAQAALPNADPRGTGPSVLGPFHIAGAPSRPVGGGAI